MNRILTISFALAMLSCKTKEQKEIKTDPITQRQAQPVAEVSDLPKMQIRLLDGKIIDLATFSGRMVLVLFQPDCDHCQHEAEDIKQNLEHFKNQTMFFVSSSPSDQISRFSRDYKLADHANVFFGWTTTENILNNFGPIAAPSIYVYSEKGELVQKFNGQTPVEEIIEYL